LGTVGPLHGIPVLLKDNVDTADMPTTAGSLSLKGYVPLADAQIVKKLRDAGAIILAKMNLHELAVWGETISSLGGQTLNPYDLTRTPGGSSGGTGAGLAAEFGTLGIGTDTINSIRSPASANSIVGIRPTVGLVSRNGIIPYSLTQIRWRGRSPTRQEC
jgi:Asp-tRNA(Asn)/Glu-tRNA(Gln) amidotransferase A subunit family amidase